jgi:hydrogenase maturation protease
MTGIRRALHDAGGSKEEQGMSPVATSAVRIIGIGSGPTGEECVGCLTVRRLRTVLGDAADVVEAEAGPAGLDLLDVFDRSRTIILVDGVLSGAAPGTIHRVDLSTKPESRIIACATHAFRLAEALELARAMQLLPTRIVLYGIELDPSAPAPLLSSAVARAADETVHRIFLDWSGVLNV